MGRIIRKALVTGAEGQLGYDVMKELANRGIAAVGTGRKELDITDRKAVEERIVKEQPDLIIHCAAYTQVDLAEENKELCMQVNAQGTEAIAAAAARCGAAMIYISTDYVFSGEGERPWEPEDTPAPVSVYGLSKYLGEEAVKKQLSKYYIVRISWAFGENGKNFVKTMLRLSESRDTVTVVDDQIGSPTYTADLAVMLADLAESGCYGTYHAANSGYCSWYEFAKEIFRLTGRAMKVLPVSSAEWKAKAARPKNSRMNMEKLNQAGIAALPPWQDALARYLQKIGVSKDWER
ncbi:MAG: dTDP-4-dehydrorhamnose reductase [Lachnospiraceae bacterium]|nr:dTDP-4-dehydrorhamnose reductase [Lachnospiraceae bacterium]